MAFAERAYSGQEDWKSEKNLYRVATIEKINSAINDSRGKYAKEQDGQPRSVLAYDIKMDRRAYQALFPFYNPDNPAYQTAKKSLDSYTDWQLKTHLGERFNVLLSNRVDEIREGHIWAVNTTEPLLNMIIRGRDYRKIHGKPVDWPREEAEVVGFQKIEEILCDPNTPIGTMMLSISPPGDIKNGSIYNQYFYDVYVLGEKDGKRFAEVTRYSSSPKISNQDYSKKISQINPDLPLQIPTDVAFLSNPVVIPPDKFQSADKIHKFLHADHEYMEKEEFDKIIEICTPAILYYLDKLASNSSYTELAIAFNAILNSADEARENKQQKAQEYVVFQRGVSNAYFDNLGTQRVRSVDTGCGPSAGAFVYYQAMSAGSSIGGPFSVMSFGAKEETYSFDKFGTCKTCETEKTWLGPCEICKSCDGLLKRNITPIKIKKQPVVEKNQNKKKEEPKQKSKDKEKKHKILTFKKTDTSKTDKKAA